MNTHLSRLLAVALALIGTAHAVVLYSGDQNIPIPVNLTGVFLDFTDPSDPSSFTINTASQPATWDFNFFFGGAAIANSDTSLPARFNRVG